MPNRFDSSAASSALPVEFSRETVLVNEGVKYNVPIVPESPHQLNRAIDVRRGATLKGPIFGARVHLGESCFVSDWVFGEQQVKLENAAVVQGGIVSRADIEIHDHCEIGSPDNVGNVIGAEITIGNGCKIHGNIIASDSIEFSGECLVEGLVICLGKKLKLGHGLVCRDAICSGEILVSPGLEVKDDVIWANESISFEGGDESSVLPFVLIGGEKPRAENLVKKGSTLSEINITYDRISVCDPQMIPVREEVIQRVKDILR